LSSGSSGERPTCSGVGASRRIHAARHRSPPRASVRCISCCTASALRAAIAVSHTCTRFDQLGVEVGNGGAQQALDHAQRRVVERRHLHQRVDAREQAPLREPQSTGELLRAGDAERQLHLRHIEAGRLDRQREHHLHPVVLQDSPVIAPPIVGARQRHRTATAAAPARRSPSARTESQTASAAARRATQSPRPRAARSHSRAAPGPA
jgi:hypothetical protein